MYINMQDADSCWCGPDPTLMSRHVSCHQVSQAVNAWREMPSAVETAGVPEGSSRPSQDIRATVGMTGVTTVIARPAAGSASAAAASLPSDDDNDDGGLELVGEQTLDEVLEVSHRWTGLLCRIQQMQPLHCQQLSRII